MQNFESAKKTATRLSILVVLFYVALLGYDLSKRNWDVSTFIVAGDSFVHESALRNPIAVLPHSDGYDGQFYYRLALDPFLWKKTAFGITLDDPPLRGARIGYPLSAWMVSFGQARLLPWALVAINLASLFCIAWIAVALALSNGLPAWFGLAVPLYPGFMLILVRDTTELLATALGLAAIFCVVKGRYWWSAPFASAAVLTRETTLLYLAGFGLVEFARVFQRRIWTDRLIALATPAIIFVLWRVLLQRIWHQSTFVPGDLGGPPFSGIIQFTRENLSDIHRAARSSFALWLHLYYATAEAFCILFCALALTTLARSPAPVGLRLSWACYLALVTCFTTSIWVEPYGYMRIFVDCFVVGAMMIIASRHLIAIRLLFVAVLFLWPPTIWFVTR